jgi:ubiquinone/menaquinone biosynthesis C-methylase UbiE
MLECKASARQETALTRTSYNDIAEWYDQYLQERPIYSEVILPNILELVGSVDGQAICDLACGQGWVARELARRGARVIGLDAAPNMLALARSYEEMEPLGIEYVEGDAQQAEQLGERQFNGCVCVMALINIPDVRATFRGVARILQPEGWFVFVITHPCFETPHAHWTSLPDPEHAYGKVVTGYFEERWWYSANANGVRSRVPDYHRTLSTYLNELADASFVLERVLEPWPSDRQAERVPGQREIPSLLFVRAHLSGERQRPSSRTY